MTQTFIPYPDLTHSIEVLDTYTLAESRAAVLTILDVIHEKVSPVKPWEGHPELRKWLGHEPVLCEFGMLLAERTEQVSRMHVAQQGYRERIEEHFELATAGDYTLAKPDWWGLHDFHLAEKAALMRRAPAHYANHFEGVSMDIGPWWMMGRWH